MAATFYKDGSILWLKVPLEGTPAAWAPGTNYKLGDTVVPTTPIPSLAGFMFQCVGFIGKSSNVTPTFPPTLNTTFVDGNIVWRSRDPAASLPALEKNEFCIIDETVGVT